jgi:hypothetical protein
VVLALLGGGVSYHSMYQGLEALGVEEPAAQLREVEAEATDAPRRAYLEAARAFYEEQERVLAPVRALRVGVLALLCLFSLRVLSAALQLLRPVGLPRAGVRQQLASSAVLAALLRAADGAQALAFSRVLEEPLARVGRAQLPLLLEALQWPAAPGGPEALEQMARQGIAGYQALLVGGTVLVAGGLLWLGQYFGSAPVRAWVEAQDRTLAQQAQRPQRGV